MDISVFIASVIVVALIGGLVTLCSAERKIKTVNIAQERAKWREKIRTQALPVHKAACLKKYQS